MGFFDDVGDFFKDDVGGAFSDAGNWVGDNAGDIFGGAKDVFSSVFNEGVKPVAGFIGSDVLKPVLSIFQNFGNNFNNLLGSPFLLPAVIAVVILIIILK